MRPARRDGSYWASWRPARQIRHDRREPDNPPGWRAPEVCDPMSEGLKLGGVVLCVHVRTDRSTSSRAYWPLAISRTAWLSWRRRGKMHAQSSWKKKRSTASAGVRAPMVGVPEASLVSFPTWRLKLMPKDGALQDDCTSPSSQDNLQVTPFDTLATRIR